MSVFNGPAPEVRTFDSPADETEAIADWLRAREGEGYAPHAIGVFVRSSAQIEQALSAVQAAGMRSVQLDDGSGGVSGSVAVGGVELVEFSRGGPRKAGRQVGAIMTQEAIVVHFRLSTVPFPPTDFPRRTWRCAVELGTVRARLFGH